MSTPRPAAHAELVLDFESVPAAVHEDAARQLEGMHAGLAALAEEVPALAPSTPPAAGEPAGAAAGPATTTAGGLGHAAAPAGDGGGLCALELMKLAERIRRRDISPVEVTQAVLARIARYDGALRSFITVTADLALEEARRAEAEIGAGRYRGPLHGVPVAVKDLFDTAGVRTTYGSRIFAAHVPAEDSAAVAAWKKSGAILVGKNTLHEFAFGGTSVNQHTGTPRNPWQPEHMCGGSSGGSAAAVAAGFAFGALGSETGNSVRRPASFCGVVGLKTTYGRCSRRGVFPLAWSLDHVGLFARTAADAALLAAPLAGYDPRDPGSRRPPSGLDGAAALQPVADLRGQRAGVPRALLLGIDPEVQAAFDTALDGLRQRGVAVQDVELPLASRWTALVSSITMHTEAAAAHAALLRHHHQEYGADVLARLLVGQRVSAADYARAQALRGAIHAELLDTLRTVDVLLAPGTPAPAPVLRAGAYVAGDSPWGTEPAAFQLQRLVSLLGLPTASAPTGRHSSGLPMAAQIGGRPWEEGLVLGIAAAVAETVPSERRLPPIAPLGVS